MKQQAAHSYLIVCVYLSRRSTDGPAALHSCLVDSPGLQEGPLWLLAFGLLMRQRGGAVSHAGVSPHSHLIHRPCCQVGSWKQTAHVNTHAADKYTRDNNSLTRYL